MEETDSDARHPESRENAGHRLDRRLVQRHQHPAADVDPFRHHEPALARHECGGLLDHDVVLVVAALVADVEHVAKALGGHERGERAFSLDDRVGRQCRAVDEQPHRTGIGPGAREHVVHAGKHCVVRGVRRRQDFGGGEGIAVLEHDVGERAADIHSDAVAGFRITHDGLISRCCCLLI